MPAFLVELAEEESLLVIANHICQLIDGQARSELVDTEGSAYYKECLELLQNSDFTALIDKFLRRIDLILEKSGSGDAETAACVIVHLLKALNAEQVPGYAVRLSEKVAGKEDEHAEQRLSILTDLFNATSEAAAQYNVLLRTVKYATATKKALFLAPSLRANIDAWLTSWNLSKAEERTLLIAIADLFRSQAKRKVLLREAYRLTARALATFQEGEEAEAGELKQVAANTAADFLNSPDVFQFDLLHSPAISQLESDAQTAPLLTLLKLVIAGKVEEVSNFLSSNSSLQSEYSLNSEDLVAKTQLLAIMEVAARCNELSYQQLKEQLRLEDDDAVEEWLVQAIGKKLIQGQMDQERRTFTVSKAIHRTFGPEDWKVLQGQVASWKESVKNVRDLIASSDSRSGVTSGSSWNQNGSRDSQFRRTVQT